MPHTSMYSTSPPDRDIPFAWYWKGKSAKPNSIMRPFNVLQRDNNSSIIPGAYPSSPDAQPESSTSNDIFDSDCDCDFCRGRRAATQFHTTCSECNRPVVLDNVHPRYMEPTSPSSSNVIEMESQPPVSSRSSSWSNRPQMSMSSQDARHLSDVTTPDQRFHHHRHGGRDSSVHSGSSSPDRPRGDRHRHRHIESDSISDYSFFPHPDSYYCIRRHKQDRAHVTRPTTRSTFTSSSSYSENKSGSGSGYFSSRHSSSFNEAYSSAAPNSSPPENKESPPNSTTNIPARGGRNESGQRPVVFIAIDRC